MQIRFECLSTRNAAGLFNMSYFGKFYVSGSDAQQAVDWIFSNKLDVAHGKTVYTCMLNKRAGVEADLTVSVIDADEGLGNSSALNKCKTVRGSSAFCNCVFYYDDIITSTLFVP
jgi:glycine cleavage system aminomethyltransferase T